MSLFKASDHAHKYKAKNLKRASHGGISTSKKVRVPTQSKSKKVFCRNCNCQNTESAKSCVQCEVTIKEPKLRRKMR